jgi:hypothetical protein
MERSFRIHKGAIIQQLKYLSQRFETFEKIGHENQNKNQMQFAFHMTNEIVCLTALPQRKPAAMARVTNH